MFRYLRPWSFFCIGALLAGGTEFAEAVVYLTTDQALHLAFPDAERIETVTLSLNHGIRARIEKRAQRRVRFSKMPVHIGMIHEQPIGYAMIHDVKGKARPITFMVVIGPRGKIKRVEVLAYRESHGYEIRYPFFLKQFAGKSISDPLRNKRDIRNISGATISCRAIADGVRTLLALWEEVYAVRNVPHPEVGLEKKKGDGMQERFIDPADLSTGVSGEAAP